MKKKISSFTKLLLAFSMLAGTPLTMKKVNAESSTTTIKVFETTDIHGYLMDTSSMNEDTFTYRMAYVANQVNAARESEDYDDVLLLNGGNNYEGTPVSNLLQGAAMRAMFDIMDYDATSVGNHEFDWDAAASHLQCDDQGTIASYDFGDYSGDPDTPVLAYNLYYAGTTDRVDWAQDYVIVDKAGYKVALIGYISDFSSQVMSTRMSPYEIDDDIDHLKEEIAEVNATENPDVTVVVAFGGASSIAAQMDADQVDLVTGGHNQASNGSAGIADNGVAYLESACYGQGYCSADIVIDNETKEVTVTVDDPTKVVKTGPGADNSCLYAANAEGNLDPDVLALSQAAWAAVKDDMEEELGYIDTSINAKASVSDNGATSAGNWVTGLMLRWAQENYDGVVAAFYNNGGLRTSINLEDGQTTRTITAANIYTINPFCNYWYIYEINGAQLKQQILNGLSNGNYGNEMSGLTFTYTAEEVASSSSDEGGHGGGPGGPSKTKYNYTITSITLADGTVVDMDDTETMYKVCTSNYSGTLAGGVFESLTPLNENEAPIDNVTLIDLVREEAKANDGYISVDTSARGTLDEGMKFEDVPEDKWYYEYVAEAYEAGLMTGKSETTFDPYGTMTRGQVATVLYRMAGEPEVEYKGTFSDVADGKYYSEAVEWAYAEGIITGYADGTFKPTQSVTRQELAVMLYRYAGSPEVDHSVLDSYLDAKDVSSWAKDAMAWAVTNQIITGDSGKLNPKGTANRAQAAKMLVVANEVIANAASNNLK